MYLTFLYFSIKNVIRNVLTVGVAYIVFYLAFTIGMYNILHQATELCPQEQEKYGCPGSNDNLTWKTNSTQSNYLFNIEANENQFHTLETSARTNLWSLFDPGHPEVVGCSEVILN